MRLVRLALGGAPVMVGIAAAIAVGCAQGSVTNDVADDGDDAAAGDGDSGTKKDSSSSVPSDEDAGKPTKSDSGTSGGKDSGGSTGTCTNKVVINEVASHGAAASDEFVELYNPDPSSCSASLNGLKLLYKSKTNSPASGNTLHTFAAGDAVPGGGFLVIGAGAYSAVADITMNGGMADDGQVALSNGTTIMDGVGYGAATGDYLEGAAAPASPAGSGSVARKTDGVDTDDNAADFKAAATATPGASN